MDRERELKIIRRAYAKQVTAAASDPGSGPLVWNTVWE